jgi:hypothetical protein
MNTLNHRSGLIMNLAALMIAPAACAQADRSAAGRADTRISEENVRPFYIAEARLPEGFPAPGPIGKVVIKEYPAYRAARTAPADSTAGQNEMFWPLFQHIKRNEIAMTAPVEMEFRSVAPAASQPADGGHPAAIGGATSVEATSGSAPSATDDRLTSLPPLQPTAMAFLYARSTMGSTGTDAADPRVVISDMPAATVLSIGVRGDYTPKRLARELRSLEQWLADHPGRFENAGPPRYFGYNSPMVPSFLRYGEVQLPVRAAGTG